MELVSLKEARENGLKFYFTGERCSRGHLAERYTKKRSCVLCVREDSLKRSKTERVKEQNKKYKQTKEYKEQQKKYKSTEEYRKKAAEWVKNDRLKNTDKYLRKEAESRCRRRDNIRAYNAKHYMENKDLHKQKAEKFRSENPCYYRFYNSKRRSLCKAFSSCELTNLVSLEAASLANDRSLQTGIDWHVDHMIPLQAKKVSGLHVWNNLQVIPAFMNLKKNNKMQLTNNLDWIKE